MVAGQGYKDRLIAVGADDGIGAGVTGERGEEGAE